MTMWTDLTPNPSPEERGVGSIEGGLIKEITPSLLWRGLGVKLWHIRHDWSYSIRSGCWK